LIPASRTLREITLVTEREAAKYHYESIVQSIPETVRRQWMTQLFKLKGIESRSCLQWLREPPRRRSPKTLNQEFQKLEFLKQLGVQRYEIEIPFEKQRIYAQRMRMQRPARFK